MKFSNQIIVFLMMTIIGSSCVSKKVYNSALDENEQAQMRINKLESDLDVCLKEKSEKIQSITILNGDYRNLKSELDAKNELIADLKKQREQQLSQVGDLTVLSKTANDNIGQTIKQLEQKDKYINLLQMAKTKTDSINLALAVNLKSVLKKGIEDEDIEVKVDKTVVFINLSDKMLFESGSANISPKASDVLSKIADIISTRPDLEVMVEGYTDNQPINTNCINDNWDLSVKRSTAVVRVLQTQYGIDPNKLIAAGRGEYNAISDNDTAENRAMNRRTRIIILPKLNQFYDLLNPSMATK